MLRGRPSGHGKLIKKMGDRMNRVLFLDRDGVICRDRADYVKSWEEFRFIPGVKAALRALREAGITVLIITNQSVINRGIVTREALDSLHRKMIRDIARAGGEISGIYYCPHRPDEGCDCRKPGTALLETGRPGSPFESKKMRLRGRYPEGPGGGKRGGLPNHFGSNRARPRDIEKDISKGQPRRQLLDCSGSIPLHRPDHPSDSFRFWISALKKIGRLL